MGGVAVRCIFIISAMIFLLVLSACAPLLYTYRRTAAEQTEPRPVLETDSDVGTWQTLDVTVTYSFTKTEAGIALSGKIDLNEGFRYRRTDIANFNLWISFADAEMRPIEKKELLSVENLRLTDRLYFDETIELPENTETFAFGYSGQIRGSASEAALQNTWDSPDRHDPLGIRSRRGADSVIHPAGP
jgi:hypothetical protein